MNIKRRFSRGFTLIELMVVIIIVGLLSSIAVISFNDVQAKVRDTSVLSDLDAMEAAQANYAVKNNVVGKAYYGSAYDSDLDFAPSEGNIIDVALNGTDYCIRGYNLSGNKKSIYNAFTRESIPGVCSGNQYSGSNRGIILPSAAAIAASPAYSGNLKWLQTSAAGEAFACGVASNFRAYCWGRNDMGQLGDGTGGTANQYSISPVAVSTSGVLNGKLIKSVEAGELHACAIASDDKVYCWGLGKQGQLGNGVGDLVTDYYSNVPVAVGGVACAGALCDKTVKSLTTGGYGGCVVASDDNAYCWGANWNGELGKDSAGMSNIPVAVYTGGALSGKTIKVIASGDYHSCVIASDNNAYCWGDAYNNSESHPGGLGDGVITSNSYEAVAVNTTGVLSGKKIKVITVGYYGTCAIASDDKAYCWGDNHYPVLGDGTTNDSYLPVAVGGVNCTGDLCGKTVKSISMGITGAHTCATTSDDKMYCWGRNDNGAVGNNGWSNKLVPTAVYTGGVLSGKKIVGFTVGGLYSFTIAVDSEGNAYSWGSNLRSSSATVGGQLGIGVEPATTASVNVPTALATVTIP